MENGQRVYEATTRYRERTQIREERLGIIEQKGIQAVESEDRIRTRGAIRGIIGNATAVLEAVIAENDLLRISYLVQGVAVSRPICRLRIINGSSEKKGTGWMASPTLLITNNHVLPTKQDASHCLADFNYQEDVDLNLPPLDTFRPQPERFFYTSDQLDFTLVAMEPVNSKGVRLANFSFLHLIAESGKALLRESLSIIQHPGGDTKHIALRNNQLIDIFDDYAYYATDTKQGSSGSPVFNDEWQVVALHHTSIPRRDEQGRWKALGGGVWQENMGEDQVDWEANEGIRISSIFTHLKTKSDWTTEEKTLLQEMGVEFS